MKVCVYGLGHLGSVTAACLARVGHDVTAVELIEYPQGEPMLGDMMITVKIEGLRSVEKSEILWVTFDTPVDDRGRADVDFVLGKIREIMPMVAEPTPIIVSSQLPVGTIRKLEEEFPRHMWVCIPENLRHGTAVENFLHPDRVVVGYRSKEAFDRVKALLGPITDGYDRIIGMSIESAEMVKHAINAFLAMSIAFINEISTICETVGADPKEVERGLKTEERIGSKAYLTPGGPYTGKTLARDVKYLREWSDDYECPLIWAVEESNQKRGGE